MAVEHDSSVTLRRQLDAIVRKVRLAHKDAKRGPVVADIPFTIDHDWTGDEAIHFTIVVRDPAGPIDFDAIDTIRDDLYARLRQAGIERLPYSRVHLESEQRALDAEDAAEASPPARPRRKR